MLVDGEIATFSERWKVNNIFKLFVLVQLFEGFV